MSAETVMGTKNTLHTLASKVYILATGLQNAAPPGTTGQSIQYLFEAATLLEKASTDAEKLLPESNNSF